jgi:hypothetical protein
MSRPGGPTAYRQSAFSHLHLLHHATEALCAPPSPPTTRRSSASAPQRAGRAQAKGGEPTGLNSGHPFEIQLANARGERRDPGRARQYTILLPRRQRCPAHRRTRRNAQAPRKVADPLAAAGTGERMYTVRLHRGNDASMAYTLGDDLPHTVRGNAEWRRAGLGSARTSQPQGIPAEMDERFASALGRLCRNDAPLAGERAATRGRRATEGGDAHASARRALAHHDSPLIGERAATGGRSATASGDEHVRVRRALSVRAPALVCHARADHHIALSRRRFLASFASEA